MDNLPTALSALRWHRCRFKLANTRRDAASHSHFFVVTEAILKSVTEQLAKTDPRAASMQIIYHHPGRRHTEPIKYGEEMPVDLMFLNADAELCRSWLSALPDYFTAGQSEKNFLPVDCGTLQERSLEILMEEFNFQKQQGEICLEFLSPVPFKPGPSALRTHLTKSEFIKLFTNRFSRICNTPIHCIINENSIEVLPCYWSYTEIRHSSRSEPGSTQYINGCSGKLYLKGDFGQILPLLILGSELHCGSVLGFSQGYYLLHEQSPAFFSCIFPRKKHLTGVALRVLEERDDFCPETDTTGARPAPENFIENLYEQLTGNKFQTSASHAFIIPKQSGGSRVIERFEAADQIVHRYLLETISDYIERLFEKSSVGFRKGMSREIVAQKISSAIEQGNRFVVRSDIEDFFPSIEHQRLERLLRRYIPESDETFIRLILQCVKTGFELHGETHQRDRGISQGSPLSPLLANLYLDDFDEAAAGWNCELIRFADDFLLLTKTREDAEKAMQRAVAEATDAGLKLKDAKTSLGSVEEGFEFLGMYFDGGGLVSAPDIDLSAVLRKPVYIEEPHVFIGIHNDSLSVSRKSELIQTIPLRRISEIIALGGVSLSTVLISKCAQGNIPITLTLSNGYHVATIKPESKDYYSLCALHPHFYRIDLLINCLAHRERISPGFAVYLILILKNKTLHRVVRKSQPTFCFVKIALLDDVKVDQPEQQPFNTKPK